MNKQLKRLMLVLTILILTACGSVGPTPAPESVIETPTSRPTNANPPKRFSVQRHVKSVAAISAKTLAIMLVLFKLASSYSIATLARSWFVTIQIPMKTK